MAPPGFERTADYTPEVRFRLDVARTFLLVVCAAGLGAGLAKVSPLKAWTAGLSSNKATPKEIREFGSRRPNPERAAIIKRFWRRRRPPPSTLVNEYRQLFWQRVREAEEKFLDSAAPGWKT